MIPIKVYCGCGQHYAFDVEAVDGRMPTTVACPACGTDGTEAANSVIAQSVAPPLTVAAAPAAAAPVGGPRLRVASHAAEAATAPASARSAIPRGMASFVPKVERPQAEIEARAKILWGDAPEEVTKFLMLHSFSVDEATAVVGQMYQERLSTIRKNGGRKIVFGVVLMCVPVVALLIFLSMGILPLKLFGLTVLVGLYGAWLVLKGCFMVFAPRFERGDVSEH